LNEAAPDPRATPASDPATRAAFNLEYAGPALAAGTMDAGELGTALVSVGQLIRQANKAINGDRASVVVSVHARFERGSFDVLLEVLQTLAPQGTLEQVKDVPYILALLGFADTGNVARTGLNLLKLLKWLKDKMITEKRVNPQTGIVTVSTAGANSPVTVHNHVVILAEDPEVRQAINGLTQPLREPGVEAVRIKQEDRVVEEVRKGEIPQLPPGLSEPTRDLGPEERVTAVEVVKPAFRENMAWELSEGGPAFSAMVKDENFLARIAHRTREFRKGDVIRVKLRTDKIQTPQGLRTEHTVVEVLQELPPPGVLIPRVDAEGIRPKRAIKFARSVPEERPSVPAKTVKDAKPRRPAVRTRKRTKKSKPRDGRAPGKRG
jgi:hypothetical protein